MADKKEKYTVQEKIQEQARLCSEKGYPHFAPHDGICWRCGQQIYERMEFGEFVTGCPFCLRSYCE